MMIPTTSHPIMSGISMSYPESENIFYVSRRGGKLLRVCGTVPNFHSMPLPNDGLREGVTSHH
ncbi:hypothetical protein M413DRAFT_346011 [Hebeloma cylindrosporum]|uniref:Uncharacterized protein n=1 Tax=Hebeloma cylindrosporum TaxID=76867 RepID=A0A0C3CA72_HEBCY|nr:hypothetical protein M413DRAFT_346011 [Hebeloma cylindrosporum h7]